MPRFDFYAAFSFDDYDGASRLIRVLTAEGKTCFTDSYICEEVLSRAETQGALDYSDGAIVIADSEGNNDGLMNIARLAAEIGLFVSMVAPEDFDVPADLEAYDGLRVYRRREADWEKKIAEEILADNPVDEETAKLLRLMSVFEQDNEKFVLEYSLKKLARLRDAVRNKPELMSVYIKGIFESAKLDWNNADKTELREWWDVLSFAREHAGSGSLADIRLIESFMYRVRKVLFP